MLNKSITFVAIYLFTTAGCTATETPTPKDVITIPTSPDIGEIPTQELATEVVPPPAPTKTNTPTEEIREASLPVIIGTPIPTDFDEFDPDRLTEIARYEWNTEELGDIHGSEKGDYGSEISFSPTDQKLLAVGSQNGILRLYQLDTGTFHTQPSTNQARITSLTFSPNGEYLFATFTSRTCEKWSIVDRELWKEENYKIFNDRIIDADIEKNILVVSLENGVIHFLDLDLGNDYPVFDMHRSDDGIPGIANTVRLSENSKLLLTGGNDNRVSLWKIEDNVVCPNCRLWTWNPERGRGWITAVSIIEKNENNQFVVGALGGYLLVYDQSSPNPVYEFGPEVIGSDVWGIGVSLDGFIAVGTQDGRIRLIKLQDEPIISTIELFGPNSIDDRIINTRINSLSFSNDGKLLAVGYAKGVSIFGTLLPEE